MAPHSRCVASVLLVASVLALRAMPAGAHVDRTPDEARAMIQAGGVIVVDAREYSEFCGANGHVPDALSLPWNSGILQARLAELPLDATILVVCGSGMRSHAAATHLDGQGYLDVNDMLSGMSGWSWEREPCDAEPVLMLHKSAGDIEVNWTPARSATNLVQDYDLAEGGLENVADAGTFVDVGATACLQDDGAYTYGTLAASPAPAGGVTFYLARQRSESWGWSSAGEAEAPNPPACE